MVRNDLNLYSKPVYTEASSLDAELNINMGRGKVTLSEQQTKETRFSMPHTKVVTQATTSDMLSHA